MSAFRIVKKFSQILSRHQKIRIVELAILMVIGGFVETLSVSLMLPFMSTIMDPEASMNGKVAKTICGWFGIHSQKSYLVLLTVALAVIFVVKNIYLLWETWIQYRFVNSNLFRMQKKILEVLIHRPYEYFLGINSGEVIRIINGDTGNAFGLLTNLLSLFTELVVASMLIVTIFIITPKVTVCIALVLLVLLMVINRFIKPILTKASRDYQDSIAGMNKWLLQSIQGIKELKVMKKEDFFIANYEIFGLDYVRATSKQQVLQVTPRFLIEGVCMGVMFIVVSVLIYGGIDIQTLVPMLTAVAMAAVRLLPSANRISAALASMSFAEPILDQMVENLKDIGDGEGAKLDAEITVKTDYTTDGFVPKLSKNINFSHITYRYPAGDRNILKDSVMEINCGESIGIVGPTGAGKSTAVDIVLGLLRPQEGQVMIDGVDIRENMGQWYDQVGYIPQAIFMLDDTIRANVTFGDDKDKTSDDMVWRALEEAAMADFVRSLPEGLDTQIGERGSRLSGGQKQRIGIARALYSNPQVLIFDEATSALDNETESAIMESIEGLHGKKTMIIIAHRLTTIANCDKVYRVEDEKITDATKQYTGGVSNAE